MEVEHFFEYIRPTRTEQTLRNNILTRINRLILEQWPNSSVQQFGSSAFGLALPSSDVDLRVDGTQNQSQQLDAFKAKLSRSGVVDSDSIQLKLENVRIPIFKLIDRESKIHIDLTFTWDGFGDSAVQSVEFFKEYQRKYPAMSRLALVFKQFLKNHNLTSPAGLY